MVGAEVVVKVVVVVVVLVEEVVVEEAGLVGAVTAGFSYGSYGLNRLQWRSSV